MPAIRSAIQVCLVSLVVCSTVQVSRGQETGSTADGSSGVPTERERALLDRIDKLEKRLSALEAKTAELKPVSNDSSPSPETAASQLAVSNSAPSSPSTSSVASVPASPVSLSNTAFSFGDGTTLNFNLDGYYGYNVNHPAGGVNLLRANDPLSDSFSPNQAVVMVERAPDLKDNRRFGYRLDLMFGQQTDILQGSTVNETRPQIYRNIFQAYGSYVLPMGSGLQVDFGKFASSRGFEGTYTKDQLNYSRSFYYNFLPFYHEGIRATYNLNSKLSLQYWLVNGANQTEDFNGFKSQAALLTVKPNQNITITWNINYYEGQEQRAVTPLYNPGLPTLPTQPGLSTDLVSVPHDGRLHIIDSYATFNLGSKWSTALEGDYVINRVAANSVPTRAYGGVAYLHRQLTNELALNGRFGYLADVGGLFSGITQNLKDATLTGVYQPLEGFQTRLEYRRDFSNNPFFLTNNLLRPARSQDTVTLGLLWWFGGKQGSW